MILARIWRGRWALISIFSVAMFFTAWAVIAEGGMVASRFLISPFGIVKEFWVLARDGYVGTPLVVHVRASVIRTFVGFALSVGLGVPIGLLMGWNRYVSAVWSPLFAFFRPIPAIALIPLVILWFGIGEFSKVFVIFFTSFLYIALSTAAAVKEIRVEIIKAALSLGARRMQVFLHVVFPETLPNTVNAIKIGAALSWALVVASELVAAQEGIGFMIMDAATFYRIPAVYVGILLIGLIGLILEVSIRMFENAVVHWSGR